MVKKLKKRKGKKRSKRRSNKSKKKPSIEFKYLVADKIVEKEILKHFVYWISVPKDKRKPRKHGEFAEQFGLCIETLSNWKKLENFFKEVRYVRPLFFKEHMSDVYWGLISKAKKGHAPEVKLSAQLFDDFEEKLRFEDDTPRVISGESLKKLKKSLGHKGRTPKYISIATEGLK